MIIFFFIVVTRFSHTVPNLPTNFSVTRLTRTLVNTIVELHWTLDVPSEVFLPNSVELLISPPPLLQPPPQTAPPLDVTLAHDTVYTATLVLTNCAGVNTTSIDIRTGIQHWQLLSCYKHT